MRPNALYFPYIDVPTNRWTTQAILYWDRLKSIVPFEQLHDRSNTSPLTNALVDAQLLDCVAPALMLHQVDRFDRRFMEHLEALPAAQLRSLSRFRDGQSPGSRLHVEKLGHLYDYFVDRGFARETGNYPWLEVHPEVGRQFMFYLAGVLAALPEINATAMTDRVRHVVGPTARIERLQGLDEDVHAHKARQVLLRALLPVPDEVPDVKKLLRFKEKHHDKLPRARQFVERMVQEIAMQPSNELRIHSTIALAQEAEEQVADIRAAMKVDWAKVASVQLAPVVGNLVQAGATTALAYYDRSPLNVTAASGAAISLVGSIRQAIDSVQAPRTAAHKQPLAYVALARTFYRSSFVQNSNRRLER